jgi:hypothetical protein
MKNFTVAMDDIAQVQFEALKALTGQDDQQVICYALAFYHTAAEHAKADGRIVIANSAGELYDVEIPRPARKPMK